MAITAAIGAGVGALGGGIAGMMGANAQADAARNASNNQMSIYNQSRSDLMPYMSGGSNAFASLANLMGMGGPEASANMLAGLKNYPGYQFALSQGTQALDRSAASRGMMLSGGQLKDVTAYGQGMGSQLFGNYYNQLMGMSQLGESAAAGAGSLGQQAAGQAGQFGMMGAQAQAGGYMGMANAFGGENGVFQNALNAYQLAYPQQDQGGWGTSDRRLKTDIVRVGATDSGLPVYSFRYKGSKLPQMGVMAQDVEEVLPSAVRTDPNTGFKMVDYGKISKLPPMKDAA